MAYPPKTVTEWYYPYIRQSRAGILKVIWVSAPVTLLASIRADAAEADKHHWLELPMARLFIFVANNPKTRRGSRDRKTRRQASFYQRMIIFWLLWDGWKIVLFLILFHCHDGIRAHVWNRAQREIHYSYAFGWCTSMNVWMGDSSIENDAVQCIVGACSVGYLLTNNVTKSDKCAMCR
jgi:hypothetical protein